GKSTNLPEGIFRRYGKYYGRWRDASGRQHQKALSGSLEIAVRILNKIRSDVDLQRAGLGDEVLQQTAISELVPDYLDDLAGRATAWHVRNVRDWLAEFLRLLGPRRSVSSLTMQDVMAIRSRLVAGGISNRTANIKAGAVQAMLRWAKTTGRIARNPIEGMPRLPEDGKAAKRMRHRLTAEEARLLLEAGDALDAQRGGVPQAPLFRLMLGSGLRFGEAAALLWSDIHQGPAVLVRAGVAKAGKERLVPIHADLGRVLSELRSVQARTTGRLPGQGDPVFLLRRGKPIRPRASGTNVRRFLRACIAWRPDGWSGEDWPLRHRYDDGTTVDLHALRHTYATMLGESGAELGTIAYLLGHSTVQMSARYADLSRRDARAAVNRLDHLGEDSSHQDEKEGSTWSP
ncbi:MAG TPA: hypothetical protein ENK31_06260, partial [Nannocystis exedens]|nr:hypothetical protein [Nannocystis exedens]